MPIEYARLVGMLIIRSDFMARSDDRLSGVGKVKGFHLSITRWRADQKRGGGELTPRPPRFLQFIAVKDEWIFGLATAVQVMNSGSSVLG